MWALPGPGLEPVSPALAGRFLTPGPPGKSSPAILPTHLSMSWPCLEALQGLNTPLQSRQPPFWNPVSLLPPPSLTSPLAGPVPPAQPHHGLPLPMTWAQNEPQKGSITRVILVCSPLKGLSIPDSRFPGQGEPPTSRQGLPSPSLYSRSFLKSLRGLQGLLGPPRLLDQILHLYSQLLFGLPQKPWGRTYPSCSPQPGCP